MQKSDCGINVMNQAPVGYGDLGPSWNQAIAAQAIDWRVQQQAQLQQQEAPKERAAVYNACTDALRFLEELQVILRDIDEKLNGAQLSGTSNGKQEAERVSLRVVAARLSSSAASLVGYAKTINSKI